MKRFAVITATRRDSVRLRNLIDEWFETLNPATVVIHGDCRTGGDAYAEECWKARASKTHRMPADWDSFGKDGGPARNSGMAALAARLRKKGWVCEGCRAFPDAESRGTYDCIHELERFGFRVVVKEV
jgi:hypothetical protein